MFSSVRYIYSSNDNKYQRVFQFIDGSSFNGGLYTREELDEELNPTKKS